MGGLLVVPTPIGNLEDVTIRAVRVLREATLVLAEDTRRTRHLLTHFEIHTRLLAYHQNNKHTRIPRVLEALDQGDVALVSSAGTPSISDPGFELIRAVVEANKEVDVLPGANAVITAYVGAALPSSGFTFLGFLPRRRSERRAKLREVASHRQALIVYEAPHRLASTLEDIQVELGNRSMVAARELTKIHQEYVRGSVEEILERYRTVEPRGEFTLVIAGSQSEVPDLALNARADIAVRRARGERSRDVIARVADVYQLSRNEVYALWLETAVGGDPP